MRRRRDYRCWDRVRRNLPAIRAWLDEGRSPHDVVALLRGEGVEVPVRAVALYADCYAALREAGR